MWGRTLAYQVLVNLDWEDKVCLEGNEEGLDYLEETACKEDTHALLEACYHCQYCQYCGICLLWIHSFSIHLIPTLVAVVPSYHTEEEEEEEVDQVAVAVVVTHTQFLPTLAAAVSSEAVAPRHSSAEEAGHTDLLPSLEEVKIHPSEVGHIDLHYPYMKEEAVVAPSWAVDSHYAVSHIVV